jgi:hypothetical protein
MRCVMSQMIRFLASRLAFLCDGEDERRAAAAQAALEAASRPVDRFAAK